MGACPGLSAPSEIAEQLIVALNRSYRNARDDAVRGLLQRCHYCAMFPPTGETGATHSRGPNAISLIREARGSPPRWERRALRNPVTRRGSCERAEKMAPRSDWPARSATGPQLPRRTLFGRLLG